MYLDMVLCHMTLFLYCLPHNRPHHVLVLGWYRSGNDCEPQVHRSQNTCPNYSNHCIHRRLEQIDNFVDLKCSMYMYMFNKDSELSH